MSERVRTTSRDQIKDIIGIGAVAVAAAMTKGSSAIPAAVAKSWLGKQAVHAGAHVIASTIK